MALAFGCAAAVLAYAAQRAFERAVFPEPNPAILIWSERSSFVWRSVIAVYAGGLGAFGGYALAARAPRLAVRALSATIAIATAALTLQGALAP